MLTENKTWIDEEELYKCVHCGFCLQACPTYLESGLEMESPRGRIALMKAVNESRLDVTQNVITHWDLCIQCRACEPACPSGVRYGSLIESAMSRIRSDRNRTSLQKLLPAIFVKYLIPRQNLLSLFMGTTSLYVKSGLQKWVRNLHILKIFPKVLSTLENTIPTFNGRPFKSVGEFASTTEDRGKVFLLSGCVMPLSQGDQMRAAIKVLNHNGFTVEIPSGQVCCGALNSHVGDVDTAKTLAAKNIEVFESEEREPVIVCSGGCGARMKEYGHLFDDNSDLKDKAENLGDRIVDINKFLNDMTCKVPDSRLKYSVTYQDSCHLTNVQGVRDEPREILKSIPGITFKEMENAKICCGAGGNFMMVEPEMSTSVLSMKMECIKNTGTDVVVVSNPGCFMQLETGIKNKGLDMSVKYITDLLDEAYSKDVS